MKAFKLVELTLEKPGHRFGNFLMEYKGSTVSLTHRQIESFIKRCRTGFQYGEWDLHGCKRKLVESGLNCSTAMLDDVRTHRFVDACMVHDAPKCWIEVKAELLSSDFDPKSFEYTPRFILNSALRPVTLTTFDLVCTDADQLRKLLPGIKLEGF